MDRIKRTIEEVLDLKTGENVQSSTFFQQSEDLIFAARRKQEIAIQNEHETDKLVCYYCKQVIKIKGKPEGERKKVLYFAHLQDKDDCAIKTNGKLTRDEVQRIKYNGAKESDLHIKLKNQIAFLLEENQKTIKEVSDVKIEAVYKDLAISKEWKKPDIQCQYIDKKLVFELQLSTTFLSVVVQREEFYKAHKTFILWVFRQFDLEEDLQKFTQKDILYANNRNAFVITDPAIEKSNEMNNLILLCHYQVPKIENDKIVFNWENKLVSLSDLTFDSDNYKIYYFDSDKEYKKLEKQLSDKLELEKIEKRKLEAERIKGYKLEERKERINHQLNPIFAKFHDFYRLDRDTSSLSSDLEFLDEEEMQVFSKGLRDRYNGGNPLWSLILGYNKSIFSKSLLHHKKIKIDVNEDFDETSAFQYVCLMEDNYSEIGKLFLLFVNRGYNLNSEKDKKWIENRVHDYKKLSVRELERTVIMKYIWQLKKPKLIEKMLDIDYVIMSLLSFRLDMVIGSDLSNLVQVAHNFYDTRRRKFFHLLLKILVTKDTQNVLLRESFNKKVMTYKNSNMEVINDYDDVFKIIMPDLFK